jgi:Holliday junction resolvase RusA-like endonuclease
VYTIFFLQFHFWITTAFFVLPGKPNTYKPPRFCKNKRGNVYAPHNATIKPAREVLANQMRSPPLRDVPLIAIIEFYFKRPKCHYKKGQLKVDAPQFVLKTPDVDNCVKFVLDALQPRVVSDDKFVTKIVAEKKWCDGASAECTTIELLVARE